MSHPTDPSVIRRFMAQVALPDDPDGCWLWTGWRRGSNDYGGFVLNHQKLFAHRVAYEIFVGPIPDGLSIDHMCYTELCVNTRHLRPATHKHNQENRQGAQRNSKSGIRGVYWFSARCSWKVTVGHNGKVYHGGLFSDLREAEAAAIALRNQLFTHNDGDRRVSA